MNETTKTLTFVGTAAVVIVAAFLTQPSLVIDEPESDAGEVLFKDFKDPLAAKSLEIINFNESTGEIEPFKVAQVKGIWSIPSHSNYPADAANQLAEAATSLIDLHKLGRVSSDPSTWEMYEVVDPKSPNLSPGSRGVGKRVTLEDGAGNVLVQLIIGRADDKQPGVRYVRIPGQDPVYTVTVSTDKLSTKFEDWIEKDLLKLNAFDVKQVVLDDHAVDVLRGAIVQRGKVAVDFDSKDSKWSLEYMDVPRAGALVREKLQPGEELNSEKLNELKTALDDLKIIDVSRKPTGLSAQLRVDEKQLSNAARQSLNMHGFFPAQMENGESEIYSNEGETRCSTSDGVEYVLRFGAISGKGDDAKADEKDAKKAVEKAEADKKSEGSSRYIMVAAKFNKNLIEKPQLTPLPEPKKPAGPQPAEGKKEAAPPVDKGADDKKADDKKVEEKKADDKKPDAAGGKTDENKCDGEEAQAAAEQPKAEAPAKADEKKEPVDPERAAIEKDNKRKQDEYDQKIKAGEKRVDELNARFADWYYIISNATYQKIHLTREEIIKKVEPAKTEDGAKTSNPLDKFKELKKAGLPE